MYPNVSIYKVGKLECHLLCFQQEWDWKRNTEKARHIRKIAPLKRNHGKKNKKKNNLVSTHKHTHRISKVKSVVISPGLPASATVPHSTKGRKPVGVCMRAVIKVCPHSVRRKLLQLLLLLWQKTDEAILITHTYIWDFDWLRVRSETNMLLLLKCHDF